MVTLKKIVLVDDEKSALEMYERHLQDFQCFSFTDPKKAVAFCVVNDFDLVITDMKMPGMTGLTLIKEVRKKKEDFSAIVISAYDDSQYLMEAVNANLLYQYLIKPCERESLLDTVNQALRHLAMVRDKKQEELRLSETNKKLMQENTILRFNANSPLDGLVGFNPAVLKVKEQIKSFSLSDHPVFISGEEGTGKKMVARIIHELSSRREKPFVQVSCSTIPQALLEMELFGASKGAVAGLKTAKEGFIDAANGGTLFIEDAHEVGIAIQGKLLKVLQYGNFYPVGSTEDRSVDVRVIFSSKSNLLMEVETGAFRKDLFYKISNLHIKTTPLRERREDVLAILEAIAGKGGKVLPKLGEKERDLMKKYAYPGNIRELEGVLEKISLIARTHPEHRITTEEIEKIFRDNAQVYALDQGDRAVVKTIQLPTGHEDVNLRDFVDGIEKEIILASLKNNDFNISQTARSLMISRQGLKNKIKRYEIPVVDDEE